MDHQAFAQLLGNYGEFVGAIGVVVTLGYLALQIRQNSKQMRLSSYQISTERYADLIANVLQDSNKFAGFKSALNDYVSSPPEHQALFHSQVVKIATAIQHSEELCAAGVIPRRVLMEQQRDLARVLKSPGGEQWMEFMAATTEAEIGAEALRVGTEEAPLNNLPFFKIN